MDSVALNQLFLNKPVFDFTLNADQQKALNDILKDYDPNNLSQSDIEAIRQKIQATGIKPGPALAKALQAAGFDPQAFRPQGAFQETSGKEDSRDQANGATSRGGPPPWVMEMMKQQASQSASPPDSQTQSLLGQDFSALLQMLLSHNNDPDMQSALEGFVDDLRQKFSSSAAIVDIQS